LAAETLNARYEILETAPDADTLPFTVSRAHDRTAERVVTLMTLPGSRIASGSVEREAFAVAVDEASELDHSNITRIFDQGATTDQGYFVAVEYTRGITLKERIRRIAPFSLAVAADIAVAIAEALEYAHDKGVVHGDLRPHHVLLSPEGQIRVGGFAFSRAAIALTGEGPDPLYAAYFAPEFVRRSAPSAAADIYALGATLYEMLTGALPAAEGEATSSPRILNPGVPPALEGIVQKALNPNPSQRYRSVAPMLADLRAVREALRAGRSLAWSPVVERRMPRSPQPGDTPAPVVEPIKTAVDPEEWDSGRDAPVRAASRAMSITLAILFVIAVLGIVGLSWYATKFLAIPDDVVVPNLIGKSFDQGKQIAAQQHFNLVESDPDTPHYSTQWPENQIYQQYPAAGMTVKAGHDVDVLRSAGPPLLQVPDLTGMTEKRADVALAAASLPQGAVAYDFSDTVPQGIVISQTPDKLSMVARNTTVNFDVSKGKQTPDVPAGVTATAQDANTIVLAWDQSARADSYSVSRVQDGVSKVIATDIPPDQTEITDSGLTPNTTYVYTVTAINGGGTSGASAPVTALTPAIAPATPPSASPDNSGNQNSPDNSNNNTDNGTDSAGNASDNTVTGTANGQSPQMRQFVISFRVPEHPRGDRHVQFEVQDALGLSKPYDEWRSPGSQVDSPIQVFGSHVIIRIFLDNVLVKRETL
jgi:beta-lactam-binding protein with PASTA domain